MSKKLSKALVVDADVLQSAGESEHPVSSACREFLKSVMRICHRIVVTRELSDEWRRHLSRFSRPWLLEMYKRDKRVSCEPRRDEGLRTRILDAVEGETDKAAVEKDMHLIEAAMANENRVVSLDSTVRDILRVAAGSIRELRPLVWVNPADESESAITWLKEGARAEDKRTLGASAHNVASKSSKGTGRKRNRK